MTQENREETSTRGGAAEPDPAPSPRRADAPGEGEHGDSAAGRENPAADRVDADEALGNRVGGYGRAPEEGRG